jgi:hypothetical protein
MRFFGEKFFFNFENVIKFEKNHKKFVKIDKNFDSKSNTI